ncbi:hypothetical protein PanWU01x14_354940 [Parasponia andersonii]|uniref:Uncharacterized protein n=1 Tax=Parasponia andersonii TaxID=3476 RepID=A0A2P5A9F7_PARAD|nr:hypothetical protein PanWU01x14_354940 [Parasponia andersonii]
MWGPFLDHIPRGQLIGRTGHRGIHCPTRVQSDHLKATGVAPDTAWAHGLSEARAESISHPGWLGVRSLKSVPPEDHGRQRIALDPDRAFNAILGRCVRWANRPDWMVACQSLIPAELEP